MSPRGDLVAFFGRGGICLECLCIQLLLLPCTPLQHIKRGCIAVLSGAVEGHAALAALGGQRAARARGISPGGGTRLLQVREQQARRLQEKQLVQEWKSGTLTEHSVDLCYR